MPLHPGSGSVVPTSPDLPRPPSISTDLPRPPQTSPDLPRSPPISRLRGAAGLGAGGRPAALPPQPRRAGRVRGHVHGEARGCRGGGRGRPLVRRRRGGAGAAAVARSQRPAPWPPRVMHAVAAGTVLEGGGVEESKEGPCARTTPQEKPLPPVLAQRSPLLPTLKTAPRSEVRPSYVFSPPTSAREDACLAAIRP